MLNPFLLMAAFYLVVAIVVVLDAVLTSFNLIPWFVGLPWLRVHFVTLGVLTQAAFGVLPAALATFATHSLVMIVLRTAYSDVVAPASLRAMTIRMIAWLLILALMFVQARRSWPTVA